MRTAVNIMLTHFSSATRKPFSEKENKVTLVWDSANAALVELDYPSTLNAMTTGLLQDLAMRLSSAFSSRSIRILVLKAAGPHFCTGGRYKKAPSALPPWWDKAHDICGLGYILD